MKEIIQIHGVGSEMQGVGRLNDGRAVFVPCALPGETVEIERTREEKRYCEARLCRVLTPSEDRRESACPHDARCGGCAARHMRYETTLLYKRRRVVDALERIGKVENPVVYETIGCDEPDRTRNKAEYAVEDGLIGARAQGSHALIPLDDCLLQHPLSVKALKWFSDALPKLSCRRQIRYIVTRVNRAGALMLTISADAPVQKDISALIPALKSSLPELVSLSMVLLNRRPKHALDGRLIPIWGESQLRETLLGLTFTISPQSFFQVNTVQAEQLYTVALKAAGLNEDSTARVLDAFCGTGTITLAAARLAQSAVGVEIVAPAIVNARKNAELNGLTRKARFVCGDAAREIPAMLARGERFDVAILDPPRKGADRVFLETLAKAAPERIAYVSCDPATLARDVAVLCENRYRFEWAQPVDMFPWTGHVETVCSLHRIEKKNM